jgi:deoxyhypusine synthase
MLSVQDEVKLHAKGLNRVTDTCIPEEEALRRLEKALLALWRRADREGRRYFPYEFAYELLRSGALKKYYQADPRDCWVLAACERDLPIYTPGWEDSTMGNIFVSNVIKKNVSGYGVIKTGLEQMAHLIDWYKKNSARRSIGFFQIGGGIAGDFPICVVPLIAQDLEEEVPVWGYFAQISDSTTSYGSYSGAVPNEKITWGKLGPETPRFIIESDASLVAPLIFAYVLGW